MGERISCIHLSYIFAKCASLRNAPLPAARLHLDKPESMSTKSITFSLGCLLIAHFYSILKYEAVCKWKHHLFGGILNLSLSLSRVLETLLPAVCLRLYFDRSQERRRPLQPLTELSVCSILIASPDMQQFAPSLPSPINKLMIRNIRSTERDICWN